MTNELVLINFLPLSLELLLYGIYCVFFAGSVWVLARRRHLSQAYKISPIIEICSWCIFAALTIHCVCTVYFRFEGLVARGASPLVSTFYLIDNSSIPSIIRAVTLAISVIYMDVMLIYRLWVVWGRSWAVLALPGALTIFNSIGFTVVLHLTTLAGPLAGMNPSVQAWSTVLFSFEATTNVVCAVLIAFRIIHESDITGSVLGLGVQPVLWMIAESATIYTVLTLVIMAGIIAKLPIIIILMDILPPIAGISSCLLIARVGVSMASDSVVSGPACLSRPGRKWDHPQSVALRISVAYKAHVSRAAGSDITLHSKSRRYRSNSDATTLASFRSEQMDV